MKIIFFLLAASASVAYAKDEKCPIIEVNMPGSCFVSDPMPSAGQVSGVAAYQYSESSRNGPSNWGNLDCETGEFAKFSDCSYCTNVCDGSEQSPIDVRTVGAVPAKPILAPRVLLSPVAPMKYEVTSANFELLCAKPGACGSTVYKGRRFQLINVHMHAGSEHRLNGKQFPLEMHFVHQSGNDFLVLGLFLKLGRKNLAVQQFLNISREQCFGAVNLLRLTGFTFQSRNVVSYDGSLTTPPCTEGIRWFVSLHPITVSQQQFDAFKTLTANTVTARPAQPLNGRKIVSYNRVGTGLFRK